LEARPRHLSTHVSVLTCTHTYSHPCTLPLHPPPPKQAHSLLRNGATAAAHAWTFTSKGGMVPQHTPAHPPSQQTTHSLKNGSSVAMAAHAPSPAVGRRWPAAQQAVLPVLACGLHACGTPTHSAAPPPACTRARMWPTWDPPSYPFGAYSQADVHACFFCASSSMRANQPSHPKCVGLRSPSFPHRPHTPRKGVLPQGAGPSRSTCCMHSVASQHTRRSQESLQHAPHNIWASGKTIVSVHRVEAGLPAFICTDAWRKGRAACICSGPLEERQGCLHLR